MGLCCISWAIPLDSTESSGGYRWGREETSQARARRGCKPVHGGVRVKYPSLKSIIVLLCCCCRRPAGTGDELGPFSILGHKCCDALFSNTPSVSLSIHSSSPDCCCCFSPLLPYRRLPQMRHLATYMLLVLGGNAAPTKEDVTAALEAVGVDVSNCCMPAFVRGRKPSCMI